MATENLDVRHQQKNDTAINWQNNNPILLNGEIGYDNTNNLFKVGDGIRTWNEIEQSFKNYEDIKQNIDALISEKQIQPDWNQNNDTVIDYIKNRPFYTGDPIDVEIFSGTDLPFDEMGGMFAYAQQLDNLLFEDGKDYAVMWDGTLYEVIAMDFNKVAIVMGNMALAGVGTDTGEPFLIMQGIDSSLLIGTFSNASTHTIIISGALSEIYKIDNKYLNLADGFEIDENGKISATGVYDAGKRVFIRSQNTAYGYIDVYGEIFNTYEDHPGNLYLKNEATGDNSHAEGASTKAIGNYSHAEGNGTQAIGAYSHAEGNSTQAHGHESHSEGISTQAIGWNSHAEGLDTQSHGNSSHAEGRYTQALGEGSHVEGYFTTASGKEQHVQGRSNIEDAEGKYAHIVGNGASQYSRSNAHTLDWSGNAWFSGKVTSEGVPTNPNDLVTKQYVDTIVNTTSQLITITENTTISSVHAQKLIMFTGTSVSTITLPSSGMKLLDELEIYNASASDLIITGSLRIGSVASANKSITLSEGNGVTLKLIVSSGAGMWLIIGTFNEV